MSNVKKIKQIYTNVTDFKSDVYDKLRQAQQLTLEEMRKHLIKIINKEVYDKTAFGNVIDRENGEFDDEDYMEYDRTYSLRDVNMWKITKPYVKAGTVRGNIVADENYNLIRNSDTWQHASPKFVKSKSDFRTLTVNEFISIIQNGIKAENSVFGEVQSRPFWNKFIKWSKKQYISIFQKKCKGLGLDFGNVNLPSYLKNSGHFKQDDIATRTTKVGSLLTEKVNKN